MADLKMFAMSEYNIYDGIQDEDVNISHFLQIYHEHMFYPIGPVSFGSDCVKIR